MHIAIAEFWSLLTASRLLTAEQVQQLAGDFGQVRAARGGADAAALAEWLLSRNVLSPYQARILLAGRPGPFYYGEYRVYDRIDGGRLAGQFRAVHAPTGHPVLLEFLTGAVLSDPRLWAAAAANVLAARGIASPHVQRVFEPVDLQAFKFVVSEDLRGVALDERLAAGRLPPAEACRIARQAAMGLAQMHQLGRVHGDVRLASAILEGSGAAPNVKLDYAAHQPPAPHDFSQQQPGSRLDLAADYLAPELTHAGRTPDALSDVYALGCVLYALLSGGLPFAGGSVQQKLARHASEPIRPLESLGVPQPLAQIVAYMMAKNPSVRFQSAAQVAEQLAQFVDPAALNAAPPRAAPTLAAYDHFLQQKHGPAAAPPPSLPVAAPAAMPVAPPPPPPLPMGTALAPPTPASLPVGTAVAPPAPPEPSPAPAPFSFDTRLAPASGPAVAVPAAAAAPASAGPAIQLNVPERKRSGLTAEEVLRRRAAQQKRNLIVGVSAASVLAIGAIVAFNVWGRSAAQPIVAEAPDEHDDQDELPIGPLERPRETESKLSSAVTPASTTGGKTGKTLPGDSGSATGSGTRPGDAAVVQEVVPDDGNTLWASPTSGQPVSFRCVPPEGQVFLILRPAEMVAAGSEGAKVLQALGPEFDAHRRAWESASGFLFNDIEQLIVTLHNNDAQFPRTSFVVHTREPFTREGLVARWGNPQPTQEQSQTWYSGPAWSYYIPPADGEMRTFAMGQPRDIQEVAAVAGDPPRLFRDMERMRRTTDDQRHFTLLLFPQFLFNDDGQPLFAGERGKVRQPLQWLLGDNLQAASASAHFGDALYLEVRMIGTLDNDPYKLAQALRDRLNEVPRSLEDYFVALTPPPYWKKLAFRYPGMVGELHRQTRVGVEEGQAVVNSVLPPAAGHNLVLGGELLLATSPGQAVAVAAPPAAAGPKTIEEALQLKTSYSFDNQSLEFAMRDLAADVKDLAQGAPFQFDIKIIGADLEKDGITRNQTIRDFKQEGRSVAEILTALVMKANPITTVQEPTEADQKLIWVVGPDPDSGQPVVLITTRAAAGAKGYKLPAVFVK